MKSLIAYYSRKGNNYVGGVKVPPVGNTEVAAGIIQKLTGRVDGMDEYDVVFLGYPNWWGTMPMPVFTFLEAYDFTGKTIVPFCTHGGSGMGHSEGDIKKLCPAAKIAKGLAIHGGSVQKAESAISDWLRKAGVLKGVKE